jgi:hypothetical protein
LSTTFAFVGFLKDIQQFISQVKISLKDGGLVVPLTTIPIDKVQHIVKHKLDFDEFYMTLL